MIRISRALLPSLLLAPIGCSAGPAHPAPPKRDPIASLAAGSAQAASTASAAPAAPASPAEPDVELPFADVGRFPFELYPIEGTLVGTVRYEDADDPNQRTFKAFLLANDRFERVFFHNRDAYSWMGPYGIHGRAAGPLDIIGMIPGARTSYPTIDSPLGSKIATAPGGSWVGLASRDGATYGILSAYGGQYMETLRGKPKLAQEAAPPGCHGDWTGYPRVVAESFAVTRGGDLVAVGTDCDDSLALEVWKKGSTKSKVMVVEGNPGTRESPVRFDAYPGSDGFLLGPSLRRWDGNKLVIIDPPPPGTAFSAFDLPDGRLVVSVSLEDESGKLVSRTYVKNGSSYERAVLPGGEPLTHAFTDGVAVWTVSRDEHLHKLVAPGTKPAQLTYDQKEVPDVEALREKGLADYKSGRRPSFVPGGPGCDHNVVVLYGFTKVTPDNYDFPLTRKAIKGHTEMKGIKFAVTRDAGQKFFVGLTPSFGSAKKLQQLIEKEVKGSKPQIVCAEPEIVRELDIDLSTGELRW